MSGITSKFRTVEELLLVIYKQYLYVMCRYVCYLSPY